MPEKLKSVDSVMKEFGIEHWFLQLIFLIYGIGYLDALIEHKEVMNEEEDLALCKLTEQRAKEHVEEVREILEEEEG